MNWWRKLSGTQPKLDPNTILRLKCARFHHVQENYKKFNNLINDAIEKLGGEYVIDKQYLSSLLENAFSLAGEIVHDMNMMSGYQYSDLFFKLDRMKSNLRRILAWQPQIKSGDLVISLSDIDELDHYHQVGGIFTRLAEIKQRLGLLVPEGFVISFSAFSMFVDYNGLEPLMNLADARPTKVMEELRGKMRVATLPPDLAGDIETAVRRLCEIYEPPHRFILRGAALGEEYNKHSAGNLCAVEAVGPGDVLNAYKAVLAAMYGGQAVENRIKLGLDPKCDVAVAVSRMINAEIEGSIYTVSPDTPHNGNIRIETLSNGAPDAAYEASRRPPYNVETYPEEETSKTRLARRDISGLAEKAMRIERYFKGPQEIVWVQDKKKDTYIIQSKPLILDVEHSIPPGELAEAVARHESLYDQAGKVACPGIACGSVHLISGRQDLENLPENGVIVIEKFEPVMDLMLVLSRAAAILADTGAPTGHAASLAREFHVPTIVGLGDASRRLKPGDTVTVDADDNVVYMGEVSELLHYQLQEYLNLENEKEYNLLRFMLHRISSGGVVGAGSSRTKLRDRETLDNIIRFCMDVTSREMTHAIESIRAGLLKSAPHIESGPGLKLHLIDLGDGIEPAGASGNKIIEMDAVRSPLFRALWEGLSGAEAANRNPAAFGLAAISAERLHLNLATGARTYILDAYQCGDDEYNYIYVHISDRLYAEDRSERRILWLKGILEKFDFRTFRSDDGITVWRYVMPATETARLLTIIGRMLGYAENQDMQVHAGMPVEKEIEVFLKQQ